MKGKHARTYLASGSILSIAMALGPMAFTAGAVEMERPAAVSAIEEVVVTARKRSESLQDVPITVSAFSATKIERTGIERPKDFIGLTSNVSIVNVANVGEGRVNIRGIQGPFDTEQPFALIIDGVLSANPNALNQDYVDIQQIEVIKGPQGALYGRNAIGGAISITTKAPTNEPEGKMVLGYGNGSRVKAVGVLSGALVEDRLLGRIVVSHNEWDGYLKNEYLNTKVDHYQEQAVQGRIIYKANEDLSMDFRGRASQIKAGSGWWNTQLGVLDTDDTSIPFRSNIDSFNDQDRLDFSVKADYDTEFATITAIASYSEMNEYFYADGPFNTLIATDPATFFSLDPVPLFGFSRLPDDGTQLTVRDQDDLSFELRLTSPSENRLRWIAGAYYATINRVVAQDTRLDLGPGVVIPEVLQTDINGPSPTNTLLWGDNDNTALAFFGQLQFDITPELELGVAVRWDKEKRKNTNLVPDIISPASIILGDPRPLTDFPGLVRRTNFDDLQPKVSLHYQPMDEVALFASYGEGFRSGGFNPAGTGDLVRAVDDPDSPLTDEFASETSKAWEGGFKTHWFDRRLMLNAAFFYTNVRNAHDFKFFPISLARTIATLDKVRNKGVEVDISFLVVDGLQLSGNFGYVDSNIRESLVDPAAVGKKVPETPEYSLTLAIDHTYALGDGLDLVTHIDYQRIGTTWFDSINTPGTERSPVDLVNGRVAIETDQWVAAIWGKNIFDESYASGSTVVGALNYPFRAQPRTYGFEATYRF